MKPLQQNEFNNAQKLGIVATIIILTNLIGNSSPPASILLTPFTMAILSGLVLSTDLYLITRIALSCFTLILNDLLIKTFAGGFHDTEGQMVINFLFGIGLIFPFFHILFLVVKNKEQGLIKKAITLLICPVMMISYISYFSSYGLIYVQDSNHTKADALQTKTFVADLDYSKHIVVHQNDTFQFQDGWVEKELLFNHQNLLRKTTETGNFIYNIPLKHNSDDVNFDFFYVIPGVEATGSNLLYRNISFSSNHATNLKILLFIRGINYIEGDSLIDEIQLKVNSTTKTNNARIPPPPSNSLTLPQRNDWWSMNMTFSSLNADI